MKRVIGFAMFFIAVGMIIELFIESVFFSVCIVITLLIIGYNLFMSEKCPKKKRD